jgi:hypothetical protein
MLLFSEGNCAMNAPRYWQRRNELLRDIGNGAMNAPQYWQRHNELLHDGVSTKRMGILSSAYDEMNFISALGIRFRIANSCTKWR